MRILHTADWHLADRLRHIDRSADLRRAVEQVADYCERHAVDVLLVAGDLLSDLARADVLQQAFAHLSQVFRRFLMAGGTIVTLTGNHDNETFCHTLHRAFQLAAPVAARHGELLGGGRLYLAVRPAAFRLADRAGQQVEFVCLPYPTPGRYLESRQLSGGADKHQLLRAAFLEKLRAMRSYLQPQLARVLAMHISVASADWPILFRFSADEDIVIPGSAIGTDWDYVALGHLHRPQTVGSRPHVRYSGSIERLDMGEREDQKSVVLVEIRGAGDVTDPLVLPLKATPFYDVVLRHPRDEIPRLLERYPRASDALVRCRVHYQPGLDNLPEILADLSRAFPRCYERSWKRVTQGRLRQGISTSHVAATVAGADVLRAQEPPSVARSLSDTVLGYLREVLPDNDRDREQLLAFAEKLLEEKDNQENKL